MTGDTLSYPEGIDCTWLALDRQGNVGLFLTGGAGPILVSVLVGDGMPYDAIEKVLGGLPKISEAIAVAGDESSDVFLKFAEKGLFVYDWTDVHRSRSRYINAYERIAMPCAPLTRTQLQNDGVAAARVVQLDEWSFSSEAQIDLRQLEVRRGEMA